MSTVFNRPHVVWWRKALAWLRFRRWEYLGEAEHEPPLLNIDGTFHQELTSLINRHSLENDSDTPDFILAGYIRLCLDAWDTSVKARDKWYDFDPWAKIREPLPDPPGAWKGRIG